jgi:hypothetical protein
VEQGQINLAPHPPVLAYATGATEPDEPVLRETADGIELDLPPPALSRQLVVPAVQVVLAHLLLPFGVVATSLAAFDGPFVAAIIIGALTVLVFTWGRRALKRLVRVARHGRSTTIIGTSGEWLTMTSPWLPEDRPYRLPRASITAVRVDDSTVAPSIVRFVRLRVVLRNEDVFDLRIAARDYLALAPIEARLREALGLGPRNFSPPVAAVHQRPDLCAS